MVKYLGPKLKIIRKFGELISFSNKIPKKRKNSPGQHGKFLNTKYKKKTLISDNFKNRLIEKQKLRYNYGVTNKQLFLYYLKAKKSNIITDFALLKILELRLDNIVYKLGFAPSIRAARQLVNHKHILVNTKIVNIPSFLCRNQDIISTRKSSFQRIKSYLFSEQIKSKALKKQLLHSNNFIQLGKGSPSFFIFRVPNSSLHKRIKNKLIFIKILPSYLKINLNSCTGKVVDEVKRSDIMLNINESKIIEFFSKY